MVFREMQHSWSAYLDKEKQDKIFVRYVFAPDFTEIEEFAIIYLTTIGEKTVEVVRYDCCGNEAVNVHKFYCHQPKKIFLNRQKSFDTVLEFMEDIEKNWRIYKARFLEK